VKYLLFFIPCLLFYGHPSAADKSYKSLNKKKNIFYPLDPSGNQANNSPDTSTVLCKIYESLSHVTEVEILKLHWYTQPRGINYLSSHMAGFTRPFFFNHSGDTIPYEPSCTFIEYQMGSKREQNLNIRHQQKFFKTLSMALGFYTHGSDGFYPRMQYRDKHFSGGVHFYSASRRYAANLYYSLKKQNHQESGGLIDDFQIINVSKPDLRNVKINLGAASSEVNHKQVKGSHRYLFNLFNRNETSQENDWMLHHQFLWQESKRKFETDRYYPAIFPVVYFDSLFTRDSIQWRTMSNQLAIGRINHPHNSSNRLSFQHYWLTGQVETAVLRMADEKFSFQAGGMGFSIASSLGKTSFHASLNKQFSGNFSDLFNASVNLQSFFKGFIHSLSVRVNHNRPDLKADRYTSNHFRWQNSMVSEKHLEISVSHRLASKKIDFQWHYGAQLKKDFVYFDWQALPQQLNRSLLFYQTRLTAHISLGKWSVTNHLHGYACSDRTYQRFPDVLTGVRLFYSDSIFQRKALIKPLVELVICSRFKSLAYMPATGVYYHAEHRTTGGYPFVNMSLSLTIKDATIQAAVEHLNEGWIKRNYFLVPGYPVSGRTFRLTINWLLYD
jgi:hypothetical protein